MYQLLKMLNAILSRLSEGAITRCGRCLAVLVFDLLRLRRGTMLRNLAIALPELTDAERVTLARRSLEQFALTGLEFLRSPQVDIAARVTFVHDHYMRDALAQGRGAYILCCHLGSWEAMAAACTRTLVPSYVLVKKVGSSGVERFVAETRAKNRFLTVPRQAKGDGFRAIREILGRGEIVGFVMDQARPGEPRLPFFGAPAKTNTSLGAIWQRAPAPIIPAFARRTALGAHVVEFLPEVQLTTTDDPAADVLRHACAFNQVVETMVRRAPDQYFWLHNRWK